MYASAANRKKSSLLFISLPLLDQVRPFCELSPELMKQIMEYWGGMGSLLFLECVWKAWRPTHAPETFPSTIVIALSSRRLASAINSGWGEGGSKLAVTTGNPNIFAEWKVRFGCTTLESGLLEAAVRGNNTDIVEDVLEQYWACEFPMDKDAWLLAVASGSVDMVETVEAYVGDRDEDVTCDGLERAAEAGALDMAKSLWESFPDQRSKYAESGLSVAIRVGASYGHFALAEWCVRTLHNQDGLLWHDILTVMQYLPRWRSLVQWLQEEGRFRCSGDEFPLMGATRGNLEWVLWCLENGWDYDDGIMESAAREGHLGVVKGLRERGYRWTPEICAEAAQSGDLELVKWCLLNGCPWSWPKVVKVGQLRGGFQQKWDIYDWCVDVGGGEVQVDGKWVPMVGANIAG